MVNCLSSELASSLQSTNKIKTGVDGHLKLEHFIELDGILDLDSKDDHVDKQAN
jgi:hypothetical protein